MDNMYEISQLVVYAGQGVCRIANVEQRIVNRNEISYYVLQPLAQPGADYYVPCHNPAATAKMRPLLTKAEIQNALEVEPSNEDWIPDENRRKQYYRQLSSGSDLTAIVRMVRYLNRHRDQLRDAGKKLHMCDENFLREAEHMLMKELSIVLQIPECDIPALIRK